MSLHHDLSMLQVIGLGAIPDGIKRSFFDNNDLEKLGIINSLPTNEEIDIFVKQNFAMKGFLMLDDVQNTFE